MIILTLMLKMNLAQVGETVSVVNNENRIVVGVLTWMPSTI